MKRLRWTLVLVFAGALAAAAAAQPAAGSSAVETSAMRAWLTRIHDAASKRNFEGTFVVSSAGKVSSSHIAHYCVGPSQIEHVESLDGPLRHVFRHNELVHTLWPASRIALVEQRRLLGTFPTLLDAGQDRIVAFYELRLQGQQRMAGRDADVLLLRPRDNRRFGYRLWADRDTGLLLRVEVLGQRGEVLEASAFSDLAIGVKAQPEAVLRQMTKLDGYRVLRPQLAPTGLAAEGWTLRQEVPGFEPVNCVKRPLMAPAGDDGDPATPALQAVYSDGVAYVSVFIEPYDAAHHRRDLQTAIGATQLLMRRQGDWWLTVVGDVPAATARLFADALQYKK